MVTRTQIDRLSSRIEALAACVKSNLGVDRIVDDPRESVKRRLEVIAERMRAAAEAEGEPFPPPPLEQHDELVRRLRELCASRV
jgi:hypothetical protein